MFSLDVYALEALIGVIGPIEVVGAPEPLTGANAAEFLLVDQYLEEDQAARGDMLQTVTNRAVDRLLHDAPPDPLELGKAMAPLARERRVLAWSRHDEEQQLFASVGLDGSLRSDRGHMISVAVVNGGGNKIDTFLAHEVDVVEGPEGPQIRLELANQAPASGLPRYLIGNAIGLPTGTSRLWITGFATVPITDATANGEPLDMGFSTEAGLSALSAFVECSSSTPTLSTPPTSTSSTSPWFVSSLACSTSWNGSVSSGSPTLGSHRCTTH